MKKDKATRRAEIKEQALGRFMEQIAEINERLAELQEFADDHMGDSPEDITWGHVGTAGYFIEKLTELTDFAYKRGEHAK